ncbi:hypothetical protein GCM10029964_095310 [Kibdelosporangium lantanae]
MLTNVGDTLRYVYDFGDDWQHDIVLEEIIPAAAGVTGPVCTAGSGTCPPEDCGGVGGYEHLKAALGDEFDADDFSADEINREFAGTA